MNLFINVGTKVSLFNFIRFIMSKKKTLLENFGRNLTELASQDELDPVIGRSEEIERVSQVLARRTKNNPVLIGEPGVGKTAIVEGLAKRSLERTAARSLQDVEFIELDLGALVSGTRYRGQFEERVQGLMEELEGRDDVILFIDELHTIVGTGASRGGLDASNMLKPALARGEIQVIGATTLDEFRHEIEGDGALDRRFQKVIVDPPTEDETLEILKQIRPFYENHHNVKYPDKAIESAVKLAGRYISDRFFPDKALDVIDEAGSRVHLSNVEVPDRIQKMEKRLQDLEEEKQEAVTEQNFERAAEIRDQMDVMEEKRDKMSKEWMEELNDVFHEVSDRDISEVVSMITGIPVSTLHESEKEKVLNLDKRIKKRVIGQDEAVDQLVKAIKRNRSGIKDPDRPIGTFLFLGPTGVGKTELVKVLSDELFESTDQLIRLDMSEFMEKFSSSQMIGAPPGYVGHDQGGQLTEKVRRKPYSVILMDEIEKAHEEIYNILLQVMDDGMMTDGMGRTVDFKNTILIMTSNIGSQEIIRDSGEAFGFTQKDADDPLSYEVIKSKVEDELDNVFAPEFLNRLDEVLIFNGLSKEDIEHIIDIELDKLDERLDANDIELELDETAREFLIDVGYDKEFGARPLKRKIREYIEDPLSELILRGDLEDGGEVIGTKSEESDELSFQVK